jgi:tyrosyl-tRNA synthetase
MESKARLELVTKNTVEQIGIEEFKEKLDNDDLVKGYWGTAPTRSPSIGYLIPLMKFKDMVEAGIHMTIFIADLHAFLDKGHMWIDKTHQRTTYYMFLIEKILETLGLSANKYQIVKGSNVQLDRAYILDLLKLLTHVTVNQAKKAGSEVVKQNKEATLGSLVYPLMQAVDETVLDADIELGGLDQRKIFTLSRDNITKIGHKKCAYIMNGLLPSLGKPGSKMSSSDVMGKLEFTDQKPLLMEKLKKAYCVEKEVKDNPCLELARMIVFPIEGKMGGKGDTGDKVEYETYEALEAAWVDGKVYAGQLKTWLAEAIDRIIAPIRRAIYENYSLYENAFVETPTEREIMDQTGQKELDEP